MQMRAKFRTTVKMRFELLLVPHQLMAVTWCQPFVVTCRVKRLKWWAQERLRAAPWMVSVILKPNFS
jgi:hypothetical protein